MGPQVLVLTEKLFSGLYLPHPWSQGALLSLVRTAHF